MVIKRENLYDFKTELTQEEFELLVGIADKSSLSLEMTFEMILSYGFEVLFNNVKSKET